MSTRPSRALLRLITTGVALVVAVVVGLATAAPATASSGGSDAPVPYKLDQFGLTLPGDTTFAAGGHVNIRYITTSGDERGPVGVHFDPNNNQPGGRYIGDNFIPWTAFGDDVACISWTQVHGFDQHFGEGGQEPYCLTKPPTAPPTKVDTEEKKTAICDVFARDWKFEVFQRDVKFDYDWTVPGWVRDANQRDFELVDTYTEPMTTTEYAKACPLIPDVGSPVPPWLVGLGALATLTGGGMLVASRRRTR